MKGEKKMKKQLGQLFRHIADWSVKEGRRAYHIELAMRERKDLDLTHENFYVYTMGGRRWNV